MNLTHWTDGELEIRRGNLHLPPELKTLLDFQMILRANATNLIFDLLYLS